LKFRLRERMLCVDGAAHSLNRYRLAHPLDLGRILLLIIGTLILTVDGRGERAQTVSSVLAVGYPHGYAFQAGRRYFTDATASFTASRSGGGIEIKAGTYRFNFHRSSGIPIQPGTYDVHEDRDLSISIVNGSAAAGAYWGEFVVHEAVYDSEGQPAHFWASFDIVSEGSELLQANFVSTLTLGFTWKRLPRNCSSRVWPLRCQSQRWTATATRPCSFPHCHCHKERVSPTREMAQVC
jgi:hypothetical protein